MMRPQTGTMNPAPAERLISYVEPPSLGGTLELGPVRKGALGLGDAYGERAVTIGLDVENLHLGEGAEAGSIGTVDLGGDGEDLLLQGDGVLVGEPELGLAGLLENQRAGNDYIRHATSFPRNKGQGLLDNCSFTRPYDDQNQTRIHIESLAKMDIQKMIVSGDVLLAGSDYLIYENSMKKDEDIRDHIYDFIVKNAVDFVSDRDPRLDPIIEEVMSSGVKSVDSAHVAASVVAG